MSKNINWLIKEEEAAANRHIISLLSSNFLKNIALIKIKTFFFLSI